VSRIGRVLLNISELRRVPVDPSGVYFLEAVGDDTLVRLRSNRDLRYLRPLGTLFRQFAPYGFLRVHRNHAVNLARIQEIRRRKGREDWELKLEPPVNRVLPVSRGQVGKLLKAFGPGK
jgi:DNA-binding LytR/AlgR family response regulator